ncbi:MAG: cytochrome b/b6 domain-containing protein [Phenylobacterium sp.]|nr:cytochrome b/b6 domain-containing protein [Phenylobacterium sp.]
MYVLRERRRGDAVEVYRHPWVVRLAHAMNAVCLVVLFFSGLQILSAHPALYWGETSRFDAPLAAIRTDFATDGSLVGRTEVLGARFDTTGVLGVSRGPAGSAEARALPAWLTLPPYLDLGAGRAWHFAFAWLFVVNGLIYLAHGLGSGRLRGQLWPTRTDLAGLAPSLADHLRMRFPRGESARHYNAVQKIAYLGVGAAFIVMLMTGLAMSPTVHAGAPWLGDIFGGRQSARTVHFLTMLALVAFVIVHLLMVLLAGPVNELRAIITGWYRLKPTKEPS